MWLIKQRENKRKQRSEALRLHIIKMLRRALRRILPDSELYIYGSIIKPFKFNKKSDIDLALVGSPKGRSIYLVKSELEEEIGMPIDLTILHETRLEKKIRKEGRLWMT